MAGENKLVTLGKIGRTHGLKGWLRLHSFTEPVTNITTYRHFQAGRSGKLASLEMDDVQELDNGLLAHFRGYDDPESARSLVGVELQIPADALPKLEAGGYYWHQLIGLSVVNRQDELLGRVARVLETGANDVLVVAPSEGSIDQRERLIPYLRPAVIRAVDLIEQRMLVDWEADFLS